MQTEVAAAVECMMEMTLAQGQSLRDTALAKMARQVEEHLSEIERLCLELPNDKGSCYEVARCRLVRWLNVYNLQPNKVV